jgi:anti-sigma-K factor RskA
MSCNGFPADTYDRYVLGLLDEHERAQIEDQIEQQCPVCLRGVQRSMNLWLVYATTLDNAEPSADFRARLVRIADLSKRVLTFPKRARSLNEPRVLVSSLLVICAALGILLVLTWFAGRYSGQMEDSRATAEFELIVRENGRYKLELDQERERNKLLNQKPTPTSGLASDKQLNDLHQALSATQAELTQANADNDRYSKMREDSARILQALSRNGARLLQLKEAEGAATPPPVAYAIVVEKSQLIFVASNLQAPHQGLQYQIWMLRKEDPKVVSAGLVTVDDKKKAVAYYDADAANISGIVAVEVTEEPGQGSESPTGPKVLESAAPPAAVSAANLPVEFLLLCRRLDISQ